MSASDVREIIEDAQSYASETYSAALDLVSQAQSSASGFVNLPVYSMSFQSDQLPENIHLTYLPTDFTDSYVQPIDNVELPAFNEIYIPEIPDFADAPAPLDTSGLFNIDRPNYDISPLDATAPAVSLDYDLPTKPDINLPDSPDTTDGSLVAPVITAPTFDENFEGVAPTVDAELGENFKADYEAMLPQMRDYIEQYADGWLIKHDPNYFDGMAKIEEKISAALDGNTAIDDAVEQQIFDRQRSRALAEKAGVDRQVSDFHSKRGFTIPPGAMAGGYAKSQQAASDRIAAAASEVAIRRSEIELQHLQFVLGLSTNIRQTMLQASLSYFGNLININGQSLEFARQTGAFAVEVYNQRLALFQAQANVYQIKAQVYQVRLESAFADLRSFEAQVEAEKLKAEVDRNLISVYTAKIEGERAKIQNYLAELEGIRYVTDIEQLKVQVFESQVRAYAAKVGAKSAEYDAYRAAIGGDEARVRAYSEQVQAYRSEIDAGRAKIEAERVHSDSISNYNRLLIDQFDAGVRKYESELRAEGQRFASSIDGYRAGLERYQTALRGQLQSLELGLNQENLELKAKIEDHQGKIRTLLAQGELLQSAHQLQARTASAGADVLRGLGSAAVSSNNTMAQLYSED